MERTSKARERQKAKLVVDRQEWRVWRRCSRMRYKVLGGCAWRGGSEQVRVAGCSRRDEPADHKMWRKMCHSGQVLSLPSCVCVVCVCVVIS
jgi:hypothetical protein